MDTIGRSQFVELSDKIKVAQATFHSDEGMLVIQLYNVQKHDKEMIKEKPRWEILIVKTRQSQMKDSSLKNNNLIRILFRTDNSSTPLLHIMPSKGFLGAQPHSFTYGYIITTVISMRFYIYSDAVLEYGSPLSATDLIWFLPVIAIGLHWKRNIPKSFCFHFSKLKIQY